ncbi:2Fe-2S iron-sulfur cluster-binding protein [Paenactinomyces guangxiensis]|uniref:2Fe-2S iron-sulfur cluster-binding protein n=1 Tax=Paenactinomyces guangxiensis TaxID=1490290 RepID=UPI002867B191|nr:2Fe-2S iron-sulfur cluster-binding protein [Paenactinomyces guangxiensis]
MTIRLGTETYQMEVPMGANLLLEAVSRSIPLPFHCTTGKCGTCQMRVIKGQENLSDYSEQELYRIDGEAISSGYRFACQTYVYGDVTIEAVP